MSTDAALPLAAEFDRTMEAERARWLREERNVVEELADGAVVVELPFGSADWLVREILKGLGDLVVLEPVDARQAVLDAVGSG